MTGRTDEFEGGADAAREPQFRTMQQGLDPGYSQKSTLEQPTAQIQNGLGDDDLERRITGITESVGISSSTRSRRMWQPRNVQPSQRLQQFESQDA